MNETSHAGNIMGLHEGQNELFGSAKGTSPSFVNFPSVASPKILRGGLGAEGAVALPFGLRSACRGKSDGLLRRFAARNDGILGRAGRRPCPMTRRSAGEQRRGEAVVVLDGDGEVEGRELAVAGDGAAVDHAQGNLGGGAEDEGGDGVVEGAGEVRIR